MVALDSALKHEKGYTIINVDGLDAVSSSSPGINVVCNKLSELLSKHKNVQSIISSRQVARTTAHGKWRSLEINVHVHDDVKHVIEHSIADAATFKKINA